jgi:hypothetical protein
LQKLDAISENWIAGPDNPVDLQLRRANPQSDTQMITDVQREHVLDVAPPETQVGSRYPHGHRSASEN